MMRFRRLAQLIIRLEWLWLLALLLVTILARPEWSLLLLEVPLLWMMRRLATGHFVPPSPLNGALLLLMVMVMVSQYVTFDMALSYSKIANLVMGLALYWMVVAYVGNSRTRFWRALAAYLTAGWGIVVLSLLGAQWGEKVMLVAQWTARLPKSLLSLPGAGSGFSPNQIAGVVLWLLFPALVATLLAMVRWRAWREAIRPFPPRLSFIFLALSAFMFTGLLVLTQSRGGYLGFLFALVVVVLGLLLARSWRWMGTAVFIIVTVVAIIFITIGPVRLSDLIFPQVGVDDFSAGVATLEVRAEIWLRAIYGLQDFPVTGMGMNTFRRVVPILYPLFSIAPDQDIAHAHNHLLQAGLDLGLPGLIAYLAVWMLCFGLLWQVWQRHQVVDRALALGMASGMLGHFVYGMTDVVALGSRPGFIFWLLVGLVVALWQTAVNTEADEAKGRQTSLM